MNETPATKDVLSIILGGGQGNRLFPLTQFRSKPAVPIGGKYRLIDIPISNCIHSGINKIFVLTQFNSAAISSPMLSARSGSTPISLKATGRISVPFAPFTTPIWL